MNALSALTVTLVLTASMCASYVRSKVPAAEFVKADSGAQKVIEAPPPASAPAREGVGE